MPSLPKIIAYGTHPTAGILDGEVEVTEKVDGSQFGFGWDDQGRIVTRSKGRMLDENCDKLFKMAWLYITKKLESFGPPPATPIYFYAEVLASPKHNTLAYERAPKNNLALYAAMDEHGVWMSYEDLEEWAKDLEIDVVPLIYKGPGMQIPEMSEMLERDSYLGAEKIEGVVIKRHDKLIQIGPTVQPCWAKYVRADFKERNHAAWDGKAKGAKYGLEELLVTYCTEARWEKAIHRLRDEGKLTQEMRDLALLVPEIQRDLVEEELEGFGRELAVMFEGRLRRAATAGFPEYYRARLTESTDLVTGA